MFDTCALRLWIGKEGSSITDAPEILATLYPALLKLARHELDANGEGQRHAEDIVQSAATRWCEVVGTQDGAYSYLRKHIRRQIQNLHRPGADVLSHDPLSLDAPLRDQDQ